MSQMIEQEHPDGCMCVDCKIERGELSEEELQAPDFPQRPNPQQSQQQQYQQRQYQQQQPPRNLPPPQDFDEHEPPPARKRTATEAPRQRRRRTTPSPNGNGRREEYPESYTPPTQPPQHAHARYIYEWGEMRRCHLCVSSYGEAMSHSVDNPIWFASLEDRARHILEVHTDVSDPIIKMERQRAKEILGIKEVWDRHSSEKRIEFAKPIPNEYYEDERQQKQPFSGVGSWFKKKSQKPQSYRRPNWFAQHKILTVILIFALLYGMYVLYLMSQGYEF